MKQHPNNRRIILAGGSGFLGRALAAQLEGLGAEPVVLSRTPNDYPGAGRAVFWDGRTLVGDWKTEIEGAEAIINLTGKNVNCRPTAKNREVILQSRVDSVRVLGEAVRAVRSPPPVWIQASSLAIYGDAGDHLCDEKAPVAGGYPANVCIAWEEELARATLPEMRVVVLRIGFVLGLNGGALPFLARLVKFGLGGSIGSGNQWISWLHIDDMLALFGQALEDTVIAGTYNATVPNSERNRDFMRTLRRTLKRPWCPPAPAFLVKIGAPLLGSDPKVALTGRRCIPARLAKTGFTFTHLDLEPALRDLFRK